MTLRKRKPRTCKNCGEIGHYEKTCTKGKRCAYDKKAKCPGIGKDRCVAYCPPDDNQMAYCSRGKFFLGNTKQIPVEINIGTQKKLADRYERL